MPTKSPSQKKLMEAAAHTKGGYGGVPQSVGKEFVVADSDKGKATRHVPVHQAYQKQQKRK